jgi:hypothetical protein
MNTTMSIIFVLLDILLFLFKAQNDSETGFCLHLQVERTQFGPIVRASPYFRSGESSCALNLNKTMDNVQKHNNFINIQSSRTFRYFYDTELSIPMKDR